MRLKVYLSTAAALLLAIGVAAVPAEASSVRGSAPAGQTCARSVAVAPGYHACATIVDSSIRRIVQSKPSNAKQSDRPAAALPRPAASSSGGPTLHALPSTCQEGVTVWALTYACDITKASSSYITVYNGKGQVVGEIYFHLRLYMTTSLTATDVTSELEIIRDSATGQYTEGWSLSGHGLWLEESLAPAKKMGISPTTDVTFPLQAFDGNDHVTGITTYHVPVPTGAVLAYQLDWWLNFSPAGGETEPAEFGNIAPVECDAALPGQSSRGCKEYEYVPIKTYYLYGAYPDFARHVLAAQLSGLPGAPEQSAYGGSTNYLLRADPSQVSANRSKACPSKYVRPQGKSCDEYPFASSQEGAGSVSGQGGPRTTDSCSIPGVSTTATGPSGYSVCMIDATQNSQAGTELGQFYLRNRVVVGDAYFVAIVGTE